MNVNDKCELKCPPVSKEQKHTPLPYNVAEEPIDDYGIAIFDRTESECTVITIEAPSPAERDATAEFVAMACNSHYGLVDQRDSLLEAMQPLLAIVDGATISKDDRKGFILAARAAIALAVPESKGDKPLSCKATATVFAGCDFACGVCEHYDRGYYARTHQATNTETTQEQEPKQ